MGEGKDNFACAHQRFPCSLRRAFPPRRSKSIVRLVGTRFVCRPSLDCLHAYMNWTMLSSVSSCGPFKFTRLEPCGLVQRVVCTTATATLSYAPEFIALPSSAEWGATNNQTQPMQPSFWCSGVRI